MGSLVFQGTFFVYFSNAKNNLCQFLIVFVDFSYD